MEGGARASRTPSDARVPSVIDWSGLIESETKPLKMAAQV